ncbi:DUF6779 domain-containing protein [Mycobacterium tilburgii]|uniref:DUF6779 domain-containing protein n=1 Tax=Mycobacterium tilburgii TaxID=44467 RepID=UPI001183B70C|nr:DUF6779 domain-containing protein [Mycobacterium tilburgii]
MTVLSRGARGRRGGRRPGWVLLTALLVLAMGASSALVFTNRVELLKLAVILALWAAVAGAFVSVLYRRQSDADQSRVRDLKLVYDLQLDREISARREYELTVEAQLRRELASEIRAQAADDLAALRAEVAALRTSLEILFDTDLEQRPALENVDTETPPTQAYSDWDRHGEATGVDWVTSDRVTSVRQGRPVDAAKPRTDESAIIDVPEVGEFPVAAASAGPPPPRFRDRDHSPYDGAQDARYVAEPQAQYPETPPFVPPPMAAPAEAERFAPPQWQPPPAPQPESALTDWQSVNADGLWLPSGTPGSNWAGSGPVSESRSQPLSQPDVASGGRRRRARHGSADDVLGVSLDGGVAEPPTPPAVEPCRRARSRHSAEYRDYSVRNFLGSEQPSDRATDQAPGRAGGLPPPTPQPPAPSFPRPAPQEVPPPRLARPSTPRHQGSDDDHGSPDTGLRTGGQSVADLLARLQVQPSGGGRRHRRED